MTLKTYRAQSMAEALAEVKRDLGRSAVILHTRTYREGGVLGVGGRTIVEVTAADSPEVFPSAPRSRPAPQPDLSVQARIARAYAGQPATPPSAPASAATTASTAAPPPRAQRAAQVTWPGPSIVPDAALTAAADQNEAAVDESAARQRAVPQVRPTPADERLRELERMLGQLLVVSRQTAARLGGPGGGTPVPTPATDALSRLYLALGDAEMPPELVDEIVGQLRDRLPAAELAKDATVRRSAIAALAAMIPCAPADPASRVGARPLTMAFVGPTGVGKTTTIAKLAALFKLREHRRVGLITTDTYRIAAVEQLRTYAEIIGLPLRVATTPAEVADATAALRECDVVLMDTAGRPPRDAARLAETRDLMAAARPTHVHLVLSASAAPAVMAQAADRFAALSPTRLLVTKLDEAGPLGPLVGLVRRVALPLSYATHGQEVPDHITPASADRLAELVLASAEHARPATPQGAGR